MKGLLDGNEEIIETIKDKDQAINYLVLEVLLGVNKSKDQSCETEKYYVMLLLIILNLRFSKII